MLLCLPLPACVLCLRGFSCPSWHSRVGVVVFCGQSTEKARLWRGGPLASKFVICFIGVVGWEMEDGDGRWRDWWWETADHPACLFLCTVRYMRNTHVHLYSSIRCQSITGGVLTITTGLLVATYQVHTYHTLNHFEARRILSREQASERVIRSMCFLLVFPSGRGVLYWFVGPRHGRFAQPPV